jgi:hypothetical protein
LRLDPARYRERFCTKRLLASSGLENCLLGQSRARVFTFVTGALRLPLRL